MNRALDVLVGASLIVSLWMWMLSSILSHPSTTVSGIVFWVSVAFRVWAACLITAPIYREYLR